LVHWLALLNRAVFWFHPLAWWLERRVSALAEEACDAAVLARGTDPCLYSECLLDMARRVSRAGSRVQAWGMAMPGSCLPQRVRRILTAGPAPCLTRTQTAAVAAACTLVSAAFAAGVVEHRMPALLLPQVSVAAPAPVAAKPAEAPPPAAAPMPQRTAQQEPQPKRLLVIFFDWPAMETADRARAGAAAENLVTAQMQPNDSCSLMEFADHVRVAQDFTQDRDLLVATIRDMASFAQSVPYTGPETAGLTTAVRMLGALQEKKALIYFSSGASQASQGELDDLIHSAVRANVAFYPIDVRGLPQGSVSRTEQTLALMQAQYARLMQTYTPEHPLAVALRRQIEALQSGELPVVAIAKDGALTLNGRPVPLRELANRVHTQFPTAITVYVQADKGTLWDPIAQVMAALNGAKLQVSLVTKPEN
jgi:VWFA-related protein